jgi:nucleoid-associated protein YgaU
MATGELSHMTIVPLKKNIEPSTATPELDDAGKLVCQFNPESLVLSKSNYWSFKPDIGDDVPEVIFSGGLAGTLEVDLWFDTTADAKDVRKVYLNKFRKLMLVDDAKGKPGQGQPRHLQLQWGSFISYYAVIDSFREDYQLFMPDGTPVRARVHVCFKQIWDDKKKGPTNPTSRSEARRTWIVEEGQRLDWIAYQEYGSTIAWRHIAETNGINNPLALRPGMILNLTPLD